MLRKENYVLGKSGEGKKWEKGKYKEGEEMVEEVMDVMRKEEEG